MTAPRSPLREATNIFITGATGFVGVHLLREVLASCTAHIHCLVRAKSRADAYKKIFKNLRAYALDTAQIEERVSVIIGDLSRPNFGIEKSPYRKLCGEIDLVFHVGAINNWLVPYSQLEPTNVGGTARVIAFADAGKPKTLHHFSSTAVFMSLDAREFGYLSRQHPLSRYQRHVIGYFKSKWAGELLVQNALDGGIEGIIHRPSFIGGSRHGGRTPKSDLTIRFLKACFELGAIPDLNLLIDIVPVDILVKAVVNLAAQRNQTRRDFNLCNPNGVRLFELRALAAKPGINLELLPFSKWQERLNNGAPSAAKQLMSLLCRPFPGAESGVFAHLSRIQTFDSANIDTQKALAGSGVECPPVDLQMFNAHIANFA